MVILSVDINIVIQPCVFNDPSGKGWHHSLSGEENIAERHSRYGARIKTNLKVHLVRMPKYWQRVLSGHGVDKGYLTQEILGLLLPAAWLFGSELRGNCRTNILSNKKGAVADDRRFLIDHPEALALQARVVELVGVTGFEPTTPASRRQCSTRLSYTPNDRIVSVVALDGKFCQGIQRISVGAGGDLRQRPGCQLRLSLSRACSVS